MWSLTSQRERRTSGPENFQPSAKKDFFNTIVAKPALRWLRHEGPQLPKAIEPLDVGKAVDRIFVGHLTGIQLTDKRESHCEWPLCFFADA